MIDLDIIYYIFENSLWNNPYLLEQEISEISDNKLAAGLVVDLVGKSDEYDFDNRTISHLLQDYDEIGKKCKKAHRYYIDILKNDEKFIFVEFLHSSSTDLAKNVEFINFIKQLNNDSFQRITTHCIDKEYYEIISFILEIKNGKQKTT